LLGPVAVNPLASALERVVLHDHLCSIYQTDAERIAVALPFLRIGLERGEKCVYVGDEGGEEAMARALAADGVDVERFAANGALVLQPKEQAYLRAGRFEPEAMLAFWQHEAALAKEQGHGGMRGAGETDWILRKAPGVERWLKYEARLTDVMAQCDCLMLCQYNRGRYPPDLLLGIIQTHPLVFYDGAVCRNHYYAPAAESMPGEGERAVQRWLRNIRDHGHVEVTLRRSQEMLERKQADLQHAHRRLGVEFAAMSELHDRLRLADERNTLVLEAITDMFFAFNKDFRFAHLNRHAARQLSLLGKDADQVIGKLLWDEFPESRNAATLRRVMSERVPLIDEEYYAPLGEWYENRIYPSNDGGVVVFSRNVTERKRSEDALRRSEAYLEAGQRISHTGSWAWNPASGELFWSPEHFQILGLDPKTVKPQYELFYQRVHPDDRAALRHAFETAVREQRNFAGKYRIVRPDGSVRHLRAEAQPMIDESGMLIEYIGSVVDVTEHKQSEEAVRKARVELAHVNRALTVAELTASIAHEVNQPLAAVVANANAAERWLAAKPPNQAEANAALKRITRDANRASEVIARIRALLTRGEAQKVELHLDELIGDVISLVEGDARHREIALSAAVEQSLPPIQADRIRLQQVLLNLLINAMDVLGAASGPRTIEVRATRLNGSVIVRVRDSGPGIDPKSIERVFEPFFTTKREGMGMGLAISRSIIDEHGGRIRAMNNADGPGATFEFTLPLNT
jgi:PAS domain S-box-containing protein